MSFASFIQEKLFLNGGVYSGSGGVSSVSLPAPVYKLSQIKSNPMSNRCLNMITDAAASIEYEISDSEKLNNAQSKIRPQTILDLINRRPNTQTDADFFKRSLITDLIIHGNAYILVKNNLHYYLPAENVTVETTGTTKPVTSYQISPDKSFPADEIIHIKENTTDDLRQGQTRLDSLAELLDLHKKMKDFQRNFFNNNAMPGVVLVSPNTLTEKIKERKLKQWQQDFNPTSGARKPAFLDGGITIENLSTSNFREMDFENSIQSLERDIARSMGVPPILLDGGNNANITPNHRLFYLETVMPICRKIASAFSQFYGYEINPRDVGVPALQPDLRDLANYLSTLKNGGIITANEARKAIGEPRSDDPEADQLITPANVAGSASNPSQGGRPEEPATGD